MSTSFGKSAEAGTAAGVLPAMRSRIALAAVMSLPSGNPRLSYSAQARLRSGESKPLASSRCGRTRSRFRLSNGVGAGAGVVSDRDESLSVVGSAPRQGGADSSANPHCGCGLQAAGRRGRQGGDSHPPPAKNRRQCQTQRETSHCPPYGPFNIHSPVSRRESTPCSRNSSSASATSRPSLVPRRSMICAKYLGPLSSACRAVW